MESPSAPVEAQRLDPVGSRLRAMFQAVESAPVPEDITRLVTALEKKRRGRTPRRN
ncbi:MAG: hypothetical protein K1X35_02370 [Caulobacteraceae bacterium]|nr:hypothetical protein [Caulobacteraceae bacterium]